MANETKRMIISDCGCAPEEFEVTTPDLASAIRETVTRYLSFHEIEWEQPEIDRLFSELDQNPGDEDHYHDILLGWGFEVGLA